MKNDINNISINEKLNIKKPKITKVNSSSETKAKHQ